MSNIETLRQAYTEIIKKLEALIVNYEYLNSSVMDLVNKSKEQQREIWKLSVDMDKIISEIKSLHKNHIDPVQSFVAETKLRHLKEDQYTQNRVNFWKLVREQWSKFLPISVIVASSLYALGYKLYHMPNPAQLESLMKFEIEKESNKDQ